MHAYYVDQHLVNRQGHHFDYSTLFVDGMKQHGIQSTVLTSYDVEDVVQHAFAQRATPTHPLFRETLSPVLGRLGKPTAKCMGIYRLAQLIKQDQRLGQTPSFVFFPNTTPVYIVPLCLWTLFDDNAPPVIVHMMFDWFRLRKDARGMRALLFKLSKLFHNQTVQRAIAKRKLALAAETDVIANFLRDTLQLPVAAFPLPLIWPDNPSSSSPTHATPTVGYVGGARGEKGFPLFAELTKQPIDGLRFVSQAVAPSWETQDIKTMAAEMATRSSIDIVDSFLDTDAFLSHLASLDAIWMVYDPPAYAMRGSGIFHQALGLGVVPIVSDGTWMADIVKQHKNGVVCEYNNLESIRHAMLDFKQNKATYQQQAAQLAPKWRQRHSAKQFIQAILSQVDTLHTTGQTT